MMADSEQEGRLTGKENELEKELWRCLNSVEHLLRHREVLDRTLREGWMQLVSARYEMGSARISHPLFSLKPQAGKAVVDVIPPQQGDDEVEGITKTGGPIVFNLVKATSEGGQKRVADTVKNYSSYRKTESLSGLRRRPVPNLADDERDGLLEDTDLIDDSDSEDDQKPLEVQKSNLQGFGAIVSPHLRSAQGTFFKALQLAMELLKVQCEAMDAHTKLTNLQSSTGANGG